MTFYDFNDYYFYFIIIIIVIIIIIIIIIQYNNSIGNNDNKINELYSLFLKFSALGLLQDIRNNFHSQVASMITIMVYVYCSLSVVTSHHFLPSCTQIGVTLDDVK